MEIDLQVILGIVTLWVVFLIIASFTTIDTGSIGVIFRFGKFARVLQPGLNWIIPIIDQVERLSTKTHQHELPDEPENIDRGETVKDGKKAPFRVVQAGLIEAWFYLKKADGDPARTSPHMEDWYEFVKYSAMTDEQKKRLGEIDNAESLHKPLTSEFVTVVEWSLDGRSEGNILNFIENVQPEEGRTREEEVRKRIDDMKSRALQGILGPITLGHARDMLPLFNFILEKKIKEFVGDGTTISKPWGISIRAVYIKEINPGKRINVARAEVGAAASKKAGDILNAEAKAEEIKLKGEAEAKADKKRGKGRAAHLKALKAEMDETGRFIAALDVAEKTLPGANTIVVPSDMGAIASVVALASNMTNKKGGNE